MLGTDRQMLFKNNLDKKSFACFLLSFLSESQLKPKEHQKKDSKFSKKKKKKKKKTRRCLIENSKIRGKIVLIQLRQQKASPLIRIFSVRKFSQSHLGFVKTNNDKASYNTVKDREVLFQQKIQILAGIQAIFHFYYYFFPFLFACMFVTVYQMFVCFSSLFAWWISWRQKKQTKNGKFQKKKKVCSGYVIY